MHISTDEVYGDLKTKRSNENFPFNPSSPYSASKASADHLIKSYIRTYKLPAIISNCCNNYGPYSFLRNLIPKIISNILYQINHYQFTLKVKIQENGYLLMIIVRLCIKFLKRKNWRKL